MSIETWFLPSCFALVVWGVSGFTPKLAMASLQPMQVLIYEVIGFAFFALVALIVTGFEVAFDARGALYGVGAGVFGMFGHICYISAISRGPVSLSSILCSLYPAVTIILAVVLLKEKFSPWQGLGMVLSLGALLLLVSQNRGHEDAHGRGWILLSIAGMFFWAGWAFLPKLAVASLPPVSAMLYETLGNAIVGFVLYAREGFKLRWSRGAFTFAILPSFVSMGAALCYLWALQQGPVSVISVLTALYPVVTVLLARFFLKEKMTKIQMLACAIALGAIGLLVT